MDKKSPRVSSLKIGIQAPNWPHNDFPNGINKYVAYIKNGLEEYGASVTVLVNDLDTPQNTSKVIDIGIYKNKTSIFDKIHRKVSSRSYANTWANRKFKNLAQNQQFKNLDIVEMADSFGFAKYLKRWTDIPIVIKLHGPWFIIGKNNGVAENKEYWNRVKSEGEAIALADGVTAPSHSVLDQTRRFYNLPLRNAAVIPNPIPQSQESEIWRLATCDRNSILFVGRFDRIKGADLAIAAFIKLKRKYSALKLIIIGPDYGFRDESGGVFSIHEYLDMHCQNVEIRDSIEWTGQIPHDEVVKYRQRSFITIMCSRFDNFSNVVLEAMAHGCPLVASDSGGTPEMLEDNKSGLLFRSDSVDELVEKITILLEAPDLAQTMANKAYSSIRTRFNTKIITLKTYAYYENLLSAR